ncbi:hypothetical protein VPH35_082322 [Triticum aestivum]
MMNIFVMAAKKYLQWLLLQLLRPQLQQQAYHVDRGLAWMVHGIWCRGAAPAGGGHVVRGGKVHSEVRFLRQLLHVPWTGPPMACSSRQATTMMHRLTNMVRDQYSDCL